MDLKPIRDKVIVLPSEVNTKSAGGVMLMDSTQEKPSEGSIVAVGPGTKQYPMGAKVGETGLYTPGLGEKLNWKGVEYVVLHEDELLATI